MSIFSFSTYSSDSAGDAIAAETGLVYRPLSELKGLLARSRSAHFFALILTALALCLAALNGMGHSGDLLKHANLEGIGGFVGAAFFGLAGLGAGLRTSWGRYACLGISAVLLGQVAWYVSSLSHWQWNLASVLMLGRFLIGWVGLVSFVGTHELFGSGRIGHAVLRGAVDQAQEALIQESEPLQVHSEGPRVDSRPQRPADVA